MAYNFFVKPKSRSPENRWKRWEGKELGIVDFAGYSQSLGYGPCVWMLDWMEVTRVQILCLSYKPQQTLGFTPMRALYTFQ